MVLLKVAEQVGVRAAVSAVMCVRCIGFNGLLARAPSRRPFGKPRSAPTGT